MQSVCFWGKGKYVVRKKYCLVRWGKKPTQSSLWFSQFSMPWAGHPLCLPAVRRCLGWDLAERELEHIAVVTYTQIFARGLLPVPLSQGDCRELGQSLTESTV